jgi:beta-N-acetylglucosaminidase
MTQTDIWSDIYIADISDDEMNSFRNIVISDIKGQASEEDKTILNNNLQIWNYNLQALRRDMELQLSCQKAKTKMQIRNLNNSDSIQLDEINNFLMDQEKWRMSALKFLSNIEKKSLYVKIMISQTSVD